MGCLNINVKRIGESPEIDCKRVGEGIQISCNLVCDVNVSIQKFLKVTPETLWLLDGHGEFIVESNTNWRITY